MTVQELYSILTLQDRKDHLYGTNENDKFWLLFQFPEQFGAIYFRIMRYKRIVQVDELMEILESSTYHPDAIVRVLNPKLIYEVIDMKVAGFPEVVDLKPIRMEGDDRVIMPYYTKTAPYLKDYEWDYRGLYHSRTKVRTDLISTEGEENI